MSYYEINEAQFSYYEATFEEVFDIVLVSAVLILFLVALFLFLGKSKKIVDETIEITLGIRIIASLWWLIGIPSVIIGVGLFLYGLFTYIFKILYGGFFVLAFSLVATFFVGLGIVCFRIGSGFMKLDYSAWIGSVVLSFTIIIICLAVFITSYQNAETSLGEISPLLFFLLSSVIIFLYPFAVRDQFLQIIKRPRLKE